MVAKERANTAEKRLEEESKVRLAEMTTYNNLIDVKASIYNRLAETANVFLVITARPTGPTSPRTNNPSLVNGNSYSQEVSQLTTREI